MLLQAVMNNGENEDEDEEDEDEEEEEEDDQEQKDRQKLDLVVKYHQGPAVRLPEQVTFKWTCPDVTVVLKETTLRSENVTDLRLSPVLYAFGYAWQLSLDWINGKFRIGIYLISFARNVLVSTKLTVRSAQPPHHVDKTSKLERRRFNHYACNSLILGVYASIQPYIHEKNDTLQIELLMQHTHPLHNISKVDKHVYDLQHLLHVIDRGCSWTRKSIRVQHLQEAY